MRPGFIVVVLFSLLLEPVAPAPTIRQRGPQCTDVRIPVSVHADNLDIPPIDFSNILSVVNTLGDLVLSTLHVDANYTIAGRYCEPEVAVPRHQQTVQFLVHGASYNKIYWSGFDYPVGYHGDDYSWIAYASRKGYPTLSIDRLGCGDSDKPDPIREVQLSVQAEVFYQVAKALRTGKIEGIDRSFEKVVYIGHSLSSVMGQTMSARRPDAVDALVLTGYTKQYKLDLPGALPDFSIIPAQLFERFRDYQLGYVVFGSKPGREKILYGKRGRDYDEAIYDLDWEGQDVLGIGDAISALFAIDQAPDFTGPVLVVNGQQDGFFCSLNIPILTHPDCGQGPNSLTAQVGTLYPSASRFSWANVPNTGHDLTPHYSINQSLAIVHDFLDSEGF